MKRLLPLIAIILMLQGCAVAVMVGAVGGAIMLNDNRSFSTQISDTNTELKIASALDKHENITSQTHIVSIVMNHNILMLGQAPNAILRDNVIDIVKNLKLKGKIYNQISIQKPTSASTRSNDTWITTKVKTRMLDDKTLNVTRIKVITENSVVFLLGIVDTQQADLAVKIARNTAGVKKVIKVFEAPKDKT